MQVKLMTKGHRRFALAHFKTDISCQVWYLIGMPQPRSIRCGQARPHPDYGCGAPLDDSNRSKRSPGLCRKCDTAKRRLRDGKQARPAPPSAPAPAQTTDDCACLPGECKIADDPARAPLRLIWACRLAAERVATLQRFTQAQRQSLQVERESRDLDGDYLDVEETRGNWDIAEQRLARLAQFHEANLPPEWWEICEPQWNDFMLTWNRLTPVPSMRNAAPPGDARPVYRGAGD